MGYIAFALPVRFAIFKLEDLDTTCVNILQFGVQSGSVAHTVTSGSLSSIAAAPYLQC